MPSRCWSGCGGTQAESASCAFPHELIQPPTLALRLQRARGRAVTAGRSNPSYRGKRGDLPMVGNAELLGDAVPVERAELPDVQIQRPGLHGHVRDGLPE